MPTAPRPNARQLVLLAAILLVALLTLVVAVFATSADRHPRRAPPPEGPNAGASIAAGPAASVHPRPRTG